MLPAAPRPAAAPHPVAVSAAVLHRLQHHGCGAAAAHGAAGGIAGAAQQPALQPGAAQQPVLQHQLIAAPGPALWRCSRVRRCSRAQRCRRHVKQCCLDRWGCAVPAQSVLMCAISTCTRRSASRTAVVARVSGPSACPRSLLRSHPRTRSLNAAASSQLESSLLRHSARPLSCQSRGCISHHPSLADLVDVVSCVPSFVLSSCRRKTSITPECGKGSAFWPERVARQTMVFRPA